jgi:tetratricopeptide (TPR) repeat protein
VTGDHYDDAELLAYAEQQAGLPEGMESHAEKCQQCMEQIRSLRSFTALLQDTNVHGFSRRFRNGQREIDEFVSLAVGRVSTDSEADETFELLNRLAPEHWRSWLTDHPSAQTRGLVERIIAEARRGLNDRPERALQVLDLAVGVASSLRDVFEIAECRGNVEVQRASALRHLGQYHAALEATDAAGRFFGHLPAPTFDLAFVVWARANVLFSMTRYAEALPLIRDVERTFLSFGDPYHAARSRLLEANILCEQGDVRAAEDIYRDLLPYFEEDKDQEMVAWLTQNLADCAVRRDDAETAQSLARKATTLFTALGRPSEVTRLRWSLGHLLLRQEQFDAALGELRFAAADFEQRGMITSMGEVSLDIAEIRLRLGEWDEARTLAEHLAGVFLKADAPQHHAQAYAALCTAVESRSATIELIDYVREYVASADNEGRLFEPPALRSLGPQDTHK